MTVLRPLTDGDTRTCPQCADTLVFSSRYPVLMVGMAPAAPKGSYLADLIHYEPAWVCRNGGCDYRDVVVDVDIREAKKTDDAVAVQTDVTEEASQAAPPLVLMLEAEYGRHEHVELLSREGFRVVPVSASEADTRRIIDYRPAIVAAELIAWRATHTLEFARLVRETPKTRPIPFVIYAEHLHASDIENAARAGAFWVQLEPGDGARKLAGAIRGILHGVSRISQPLNQLDRRAAGKSGASGLGFQSSQAIAGVRYQLWKTAIRRSLSWRPDAGDESVNHASHLAAAGRPAQERRRPQPRRN